jgi:hypothetical protein
VFGFDTPVLVCSKSVFNGVGSNGERIHNRADTMLSYHTATIAQWKIGATAIQLLHYPLKEGFSRFGLGAFFPDRPHPAIMAAPGEPTAAITRAT